MSGRLFIEAESFENLGGWVVDSQSMEQVGSAYVMAHGMGIPVADAETSVLIPEDGKYTVWTRTRDWTAVWKRGTPAGQFKVKINNAELPVTLGTNGAEWAWQKAGTIKLEKGKAKIALHDLTGFNGRCDALYLTTGGKDVPPNDKANLESFRRKISGIKIEDDPTEYDLIVAGGGIAGICTALAAIRTGSKVLLLEKRPVLGGCNSSEIRVGLGGFAQAEPYPNLGSVVTEIEPIMGSPGTFPAGLYEDARKENVFKRHPGNRVALNEQVIAVEMDGRRIRALVAKNLRNGIETRYKAKLFADCTGDAVVSRLAGAETTYGRETKIDFNESLAPEKGDRQVMGLSVLWHSRQDATPSSFPEIDWGIPFDEGNGYYIRSGDWEWETGQYRDQVAEAEYIRDYGMMAIYANWSFLKNRAMRKQEWANAALQWISPIGGKRESHRVVGDLVLTQNDIEAHVPHPDATGSMTWNIDLHFPDPENEAKFKEPFRSCAYHRGIMKPYQVPFRCLYAKDVDNLLIGGRIISMTHVAFSCVRVQRTLGMLGEVIGMAASICVKENALPRDIYKRHFDKLKAMMEKGVPRPQPYHAYSCDAHESYHFQDLGYLRFHGKGEFPEEARRRINALNVQHRDGQTIH